MRTFTDLTALQARELLRAIHSIARVFDSARDEEPTLRLVFGSEGLTVSTPWWGGQALIPGVCEPAGLSG